MAAIELCVDRQDLPSLVGTSLRRLRESTGLSLSVTAKLVRVSKGSLSNWESGRRIPSGPVLNRLLEQYQPSPRERARLLFLADPKHARFVLANDPVGSPVNVGQVLRAMRLRRKLTQAEVSRLVGITQGAWAKWESGQTEPGLELLHSACFLLGASVEELQAISASPNRREIQPEEFDWNGRFHEASSSPIPIRDLMLLGLEADTWSLASRDARWDPMLAKTLCERAHYLRLVGRHDEVLPLAKRSTGLAIRSNEYDCAIHAAIAYADSKRRFGWSPIARAHYLLSWIPRTKNHQRAWLASEFALAIADGGQYEAAAAATLSRAAMRSVRTALSTLLRSKTNSATLRRGWKLLKETLLL